MRLFATVLLGLLPCFGADVPIGYYGPNNPEHPLGGTAWQGATLALEEVNRDGGFQGQPFRFAQGWDENPWTGGAATVVRMAFKDRVWAIIGGIDGTSTHLAEQVVTKALVPLVDPASTDRTVNAAFVPWIFSCMPDDHVLMTVLAEALLSGPYRDSFALVAATDHDSRLMTTEFLSVVGHKQARPRRRIDFDPASLKTEEIVGQLQEAEARAVVVLASPAASAAVVRHLSSSKVAVFGGPAFGTRTFLKLAGESADRALFPYPLAASNSAEAFVSRFKQRWGDLPDFASYHAYDAVQLAVAAVRKAGLDRTAIRDALRSLSRTKGVSGAIEWDKLGRNTRGARIARIANGHIE